MLAGRDSRKRSFLRPLHAIPPFVKLVLSTKKPGRPGRLVPKAVEGGAASVGKSFEVDETLYAALETWADGLFRLGGVRRIQG